MTIPHFFATPRPAVSRRPFLRQGGGRGLHAPPSPLHRPGPRAADPDRRLTPLAPRPPHFAAKAKSVIWLFPNGGPSQVDTWDYKPELEKRDGQELPGFDKTTGFFVDQVGPLMR